MAIYKLPPYGGLTDGQFITVSGPNGVTTGFSYDAHTRAFYFKESQVVYPSFHGLTHIAEDPIPTATCDTNGLMSNIDKCRLDSMLQTRVGVLGFQGSGFPEDGGWMSGDVILAAGSGFISLERFGNVIRFTVDSPVPLNCVCESCNQIFFVQDETEISSIRPATCSSKLPSLNAYGELKIYAFPESTMVDKNTTSTTLNNKQNYPALLFTRYADGLTPNTAQHQLILKRNANNNGVTEVGWAFSPPSSTNVNAQLVYYMGRDADNNLIKYEFAPEQTSAIYGALLYKGNLITKKMAVIVDYSSTVLSTNNYVLRFWDTQNNAAVGSTFTATNTWQWNNPENPLTGTNPRTKVLDATVDLLPIGTLVDIWYYQSSNTATPIYFFSKQPTYNPNYGWSWVGQTQFGGTKTARKELQQADVDVNTDLSGPVVDVRNFEKAQWGLTGFDDPLASFSEAQINGITAGDITYQHRAVIDGSLPGLRIQASTDTATNYAERPVYLWHRANMNNAMLRMDIGRPTAGGFTAMDVILRGAIDEYSEKYVKIIGQGIIDGQYYVRVVGVEFTDLPQSGAIRGLPKQVGDNIVFNYERKLMFPAGGDITSGLYDVVEGYGTEPASGIYDQGSLGNSVVLVAPKDENFPYGGSVGDICELCHLEYNNTVLRCEFSQDSNGIVYLQFKVGTLDMGRAFQDDNIGSSDDLIRGLAPGYAVSSIYKQETIYTGVGAAPSTNVSGFICYEGGGVVGGNQSEYWNRLEVMIRNDQVWVWWNKLLIPPDPQLSGALPVPVAITNPYYPISYDLYNSFGKYGVRMFPQAKLRRFDIRTQQSIMSEFAYGQLNIT